MAIALRGTATGSVGATPRTITVPSTVTPGDTIYLQVTMALDATVITVPSGFTLVTGAEVTGVTNKTQIYTKVATAFGGTSFSVSWTGGGNGQLGLIALTSDFTLASDGVTSANSAVANTNKTWNSVTPVSAKAYLMCFGTFVNALSTPDALMTEQYDVASSTIQIYLMTQQLAASGATGTRTATGTSTANQRTITLAVSETSPANQGRITNAGVYIETNVNPVVDITNVGLYVSALGDADAPYISAHINNSRFIDLIWVDNGLAGDSYELQTSPDNATWTTITDPIERTTYTYNHRYLQPLTAYYYRVRRVLGGVNGAWSASSLATTNNALAIRSAVNQNVTATSPIVINKPTGTNVGDLILVQWSNTVDAVPSSVPSGFTLHASSVVTGVPNQRIYYKVADGSEPSTYSWGFSSGTGGICIITIYSDTGLPVSIDDVAAQSNISATTHTFPSVTATHNGTLLTTWGANPSSSSTPPTGETELNDNGAGPRLTVNWELISAFGATGTKTGGSTSAVIYAATSVLAAETFSGTAPTAPSALTATAYSDVQVNLSWTDNSSDEAGFAVYRATIASPIYVLIGSTAAGVTTYSDTGLTAGTQYSYKVAAFNSGGLSSYTSISSATTVAIQIRGLTAPTQVVNSTRSVNKPTGVVTGDLMIMAIYYGGTITSLPSGFVSIADITGGPGRLTILSKTAGVSEPSSYSITFSGSVASDVGIVAFYTLTSLVGLTVEDVVTQTNSAGFDHPSGAIVTTKESILCYFKTGTGVVGNTPDPLMTEQWDVVSSTVAYLQTQVIKAFGALGTRTTTAAANTYTSNVVSLAVVETPSVPPIAPSSLSATAISTSQIDLTWSDNSTDETSFSIERSLTGVGSWSVINSPVPNTTSYSNTGLSAGTTYYYRIQAINAAGGSTYSTANATTIPNPPTDPSVLTATAISSSRIDLSWTDNSSNETSFEVEQSANGTTGWSVINTTAANAISYSNTGLTAHTIYYYRVRAHNSGGYSGYTSVANATTLYATPTAPSGLTATAISTTQIDLSWTDNSSNETAFEIERSLNGTTGWSVINTTAANAISYSNTGLTHNTTYYYRVRALNTSVYSSYTSTANATTNNEAPTAPSSFTATTASASQINLAWTDNSDNETGFEIERSLDGLTGWTLINTTSTNATSYSNTGLSSLTTYYYRVRAVNGTGNSGYTSTANTTTLDVVPANPSNLVATAFSSTQIDLTWDDNSNNELSFKVERSLTGTGSWSVITTTAANATSYSDTGRSIYTTYYYRVRANNAIGNSGYTSVANATTDDIIPIAPSALTATTISASQINLAWTDNSSNETQFRIDRSLDGVSWTIDYATTAPNVHVYNNTGLSSLTTYYYRVRAASTVGDSTYTSTANATTLDVVPADPSNLVATAFSSTRIDLTWDDNSNNELSFKVERSLNGTTGWTVINTTAANAVSYSDTGRSIYTTYYYRVRANNAIGNSGYTSVENATTDDIIPPAPTSLIASVISPTEIDLSWTDNSTNETQFRIDRSLDGISWTIDYATTAPNIHVYNNTGLTENTTYYYRVRAASTVGSSSYTSTVSGHTPFAPPTNPSWLTATTINDISIRLAWTDNALTEVNYVVERSLTGVGSWSLIATLPANTVNYISNGLTGATTYYYRVKATNTGGSSAYTSVANATTLAVRIYYRYSNVDSATTLTTP